MQSPTGTVGGCLATNEDSVGTGGSGRLKTQMQKHVIASVIAKYLKRFEIIFSDGWKS